jgi:RNA polymerase sigma-70 factor, ECF subfamily
MPVEVTDVIDGANAASSSAGRAVSQEDAALVAGAKTGDARAFELLAQRHRVKIFFLAQRMTRNREDAEDVVQESLLKAFIHLRTFKGESLFSTWLTRIAINEARMLLRRKRGSREVPVAESNAKDGTVVPLDIPDSGPNPEDGCLEREQERILSAAVNELTPKMRKAIELHDLGELSTEETAQVIGLSVGGVKSRIFHARKKLRRTLESFMWSPRGGPTEPRRCEAVVPRIKSPSINLPCSGCD